MSRRGDGRRTGWLHILDSNREPAERTGVMIHGKAGAEGTAVHSRRRAISSLIAGFETFPMEFLGSSSSTTASPGTL